MLHVGSDWAAPGDPGVLSRVRLARLPGVYHREPFSDEKWMSEVWGGFYLPNMFHVSSTFSWPREILGVLLDSLCSKVINKENPEENPFGRGVCTFEKNQEGSLVKREYVTTAGTQAGRCFVYLKQFWIFGIIFFYSKQKFEKEKPSDFCIRFVTMKWRKMRILIIIINSCC